LAALTGMVRQLQEVNQEMDGHEKFNKMKDVLSF
jgi:hypothetical protein